MPTAADSANGAQAYVVVVGAILYAMTSTVDTQTLVHQSQVTR